MIKTLQNTLKQDRERYSVPKSVQDTIPIRRLWQDGVFQFGSKYSKTLRFSDINYAIASKEDKTAMFLRYSELLNALDTGSTTKITINNKRLNRRNFEEEILIPTRGDYLDGGRAEYNAMLLDKVTDSTNSVVQERYITVSAHKKNIEEARTFFSRTVNDITSRLSHMDSHCEELDAVERLRVLHDFYRVGEEMQFQLDLRACMKSGRSCKDTVCPDSMEFKKDHFVMGEKFGRVLFLKEYASYIKDSMIQELTSLDDMKAFIDKVGYPVLVRPSYVLSGAAMNVCHNEEQLTRFLEMAREVSKEYPVVVSQFMQETKEVEFDAVAQNGEVVEYAISEHIEYAGVHSGDATLVFPAQHLYFSTMRAIKKISSRIARELNISGPFNIQYLAKGNQIKVIECNLRASRSFPFVSKVLKRNFIETATRIMLDAPYDRPDKSVFDIDRIGVKASQFSFARLQNADPVLGVDMSSTGEVGCLGDDFNEALLNALIATGYGVPKKAVMLSSGAVQSKVDLLEPSRMLAAKGYDIYATEGTARFLNDNGVKAIAVHWPDEHTAAENNVLTMIAQHKFDLIVNIPKDQTKRELTNGYRIRRDAIDHNIPLMTNARLAKAFIEAFCQMDMEQIQIKSWQEYK